jgi:predicted DNA-binding transcriptional regulator
MGVTAEDHMTLDDAGPDWAFVTNHARVLVCVAHDPDVRLREIGDRIGITERAAQRIVAALVDAGYVRRERIGRRNRYTINAPIPREQPIEELLSVLTGSPPPDGHADVPRAG